MAGSNVNSVQASRLLKVSKQRVDALNMIVEMDEMHVLACKPTFDEDNEETFCSLLDRCTNKKLTVDTSVLFKNETFNEDRSTYVKEMITSYRKNHPSWRTNV